ncbi:hypothetical protein RGU70_09825 [Herbaspirillum sp. RTI4]|uniref:hypothetical protein n=1 Tax=Herbaspirillum sp. RTI4 TaxID=3048640 RepID=UPI002AB3C1BF|nr:hypothetical protein [Herbaspirillum sp. RTI4]MDY7578621.1 hypothetical protein [Herbaspirillum sp. RTI4]MEA9981073.1 hypothetical protein [Herbaspirillum sp. RTI4]
MKFKFLSLLVLVSVCAAANAGSAPWYRWKNIVDKTLTCAQITPGSAWESESGPYMESACRKLGKPA